MRIVAGRKTIETTALCELIQDFVQCAQIRLVESKEPRLFALDGLAVATGDEGPIGRGQSVHAHPVSDIAMRSPANLFEITRVDIVERLEPVLGAFHVATVLLAFVLLRQVRVGGTQSLHRLAKI